MYGYRGKIGILVPNINTTMEMDFHRMAPEGISVHTARISWEAPESSVEALREMTDRAIKAATDDIVEQLEKDIGKPVVTAVQASMWLALRTLGFKSPVNGYGMLLTRL